MKGCVWNKVSKYKYIYIYIFFFIFFLSWCIHSKPCPWREIQSTLYGIRSSKSCFNMEFSISLLFLIFETKFQRLAQCASTLEWFIALNSTLCQWPHYDGVPLPSIVRRELLHSITLNEVRIKAPTLSHTVK